MFKIVSYHLKPRHIAKKSSMVCICDMNIEYILLDTSCDLWCTLSSNKCQILNAIVRNECWMNLEFKQQYLDLNKNII